jgi:hypothetical protein
MMSPEAGEQVHAQERPREAEPTKRGHCDDDEFAREQASEEPPHSRRKREQESDVALLRMACEEPGRRACRKRNEKGEYHATSRMRSARGLRFFALAMAVCVIDAALLRRLLLIAISQSCSFGTEIDVPTTSLPSRIM